VIVIIGALAALVAPTVSNFRKGDTMVSASRQMLDAAASARQLAISQRTTVYLVFVPPDFWGGDAEGYSRRLPNVEDRMAATNLAAMQLTGYNFLTLRSVGDQPGQNSPRYLSQWRTLPDGTFIVPQKFEPPGPRPALTVDDPVSGSSYQVYGFGTNALPFPRADGPTFILPCVAFNYLGQLTSGRDEFIPLAQGSVAYSKDPDTRALRLGPVSALETPPGNSTNSYNLVHIDWLTGRARLEKQEIR